MGRPVLPAVEGLQVLAGAVRDSGRTRHLHYTRRARFLRFLFWPEAAENMEVIVQISEDEEGMVLASLMTEAVSKSGSLTRRKEHITASFGPKAPIPPLPLDMAAVPEGPARIIAAEKLYQDLVPFGPAFHNVTGRVHLSRGGVAAEVKAPRIMSLSGPLGSPFPIDAAFHLACAWGQQFRDLVGFPISYEERIQFRTLSPGESCLARVIPQGMADGACLYDAWLFDSEGRPLEAVLGLAMKDVSGGRMKPPAWIGEQAPPALESLEKHCLGLALIEIDSPAPFAGHVLSPAEAERCRKFGSKRYKEFLAARLALKQLSRKLGTVAPSVPPEAMETLDEDPVKPRLPQAGKEPPLFVSVSHSGRYAAAAVADRPLGLDVESGAQKAVKGRSLFMNETEQALTEGSHLGPESAALRVWTIKEAVAKALDMPLPETWQASEVLEIGEKESRVQVKNTIQTVFHEKIEGYMVTLFLA